jgi:hypothetical protein
VDNLVTTPRLTQYLVERGVFTDAPFRLLDIGCSGGIANRFRVYEPHLHALAVDPMIDACEALQRAEQNPHIRYLPIFVGLPSDHPFVVRRGGRNYWGTEVFSSTSAMWALDLCKGTEQPQKTDELNDWPDQRLADPASELGVDELVRREGWSGRFNVDFIKIDVDGRDLEVILSAENTVRQSPVLGLQLEVNFCGGHHECDHSFHNSDRLMRQWGFDLADLLNIRRYSMRHLPAPFELDAVAQTLFGRPMQGDALYLRDPVSGLSADTASSLSPAQILKLASLYDIFGSPDGAAQILQAFPGQIRDAFPDLEVTTLLDLLVPEVYGTRYTYVEYLKKFTVDPRGFYASSVRKTFRHPYDNAPPNCWSLFRRRAPG